MEMKILRLLVLAAFLACTSLLAAAGSYIIIDTNQDACFDNAVESACPETSQAFYGQDSQYDGAQMYYQDNGDGTITDLHTGLMWQQDPDFSGDGLIDVSDKFTLSEALTEADTFNLAGYTDWRLPSIKELYSLIDFSGSSFASAATSVPYINTDYFYFGYGDETIGERYIDAQYCSSTQYVSTTMNGDATVFGVNHADGRIKGYGIEHPIGGEKLFYIRFVRGNTSYGSNRFVDNGNGTVTDLATGLMWQQADSASGMNWEDGLSYCEDLSLGGFDDWRMPNAKELQSIVDYTRSPDTTGSAAIDPVFSVSPIIDEGGLTNYPFFWTSTTHEDGPTDSYAVYIAFGEALGWMEQPPLSGSYRLLDVHGAGAQRSDPKTGDPGDYPYGHGPQGDVIRIYNYVRAVRGQSTPYCQNMANSGDGDSDCDVDIFDLMLFADDWLDDNCGLCGGADYTDDEHVDMKDLSVVSENWHLDYGN